MISLILQMKMKLSNSPQVTCLVGGSVVPCQSSNNRTVLLPSSQGNVSPSGHCRVLGTMAVTMAKTTAWADLQSKTGFFTNNMSIICSYESRFGKRWRSHDLTLEFHFHRSYCGRHYGKMLMKETEEFPYGENEMNLLGRGND